MRFLLLVLIVTVVLGVIAVRLLRSRLPAFMDRLPPELGQQPQQPQSDHVYEAALDGWRIAEEKARLDNERDHDQWDADRAAWEKAMTEWKQNAQ